MAQLMEKQTKVPPPVLLRSDLVLLGEQIEEALSLSTDVGIPDALGQLDLNPGNVILTEGHSVFLDWAEAYVGNPFFSLQYLVEHFRRVAGVDAIAESHGCTALALAAHAGHAKIVEQFLDAGANVQVPQNCFGGSLLLYVKTGLGQSDNRIIDLLTRAGAT
jgi:hypothetical protein